MNLQYNTHRQLLLKTLYVYISQDKRLFEEDQGISMFGTTAFHAVWERACADVFENMLDVPIGNLPMNARLASGYDGKRKLIDLVERPKWCTADAEMEARETLIPDIISIEQHHGQDWFMILDAKYYLLQMEKNVLRGNPGIGDVTKQYLYQLAYRGFIASHSIKVVRNCFLMPAEGEEIAAKGTVKLEMFAKLGLEPIQIRLIPAEMLFDLYLGHKRMNTQILQL